MAATLREKNLTWEQRHHAHPVILIHGFAVSYTGATETYEKFRSAYRDALWPASLRDYPEFWNFHWPGDRPGFDPGGVPSKLTFPSRVSSATGAGKALAAYLERHLEPRQQVTLIAHSLGCEAALHCLAVIRDRGSEWNGPQVRLAILMAAAVPYDKCGSGRDYGQALAGCREVALHSPHDWVLLFLFRPGRLAFSRGARQAVGRRGRPADRWDVASARTDLGHGEYWTDLPNARRVGALLGAVGPREPASNTLPVWRTPVAATV